MYDDIDVLVIGPGGIKGYQELGAIYYLDSIGKLNNVKTIIGVSVGAIIGLMMAAGISIKDIIYLAVANVDIVDLDLENIDLIAMLNNIRTKFGLFSSQKIEKTLSSILIDKYGYIPTLKQLYDKTGIDLIMVEFSLTYKTKKYFSHITEPDIDCIKALSLSINIPGIFFMKEYKGEVYIDGAFGDPYPILLKDDGINNILGIYIETSIEDKTYKNMLVYVHDIFHCMFDVITERNIKESSSKCIHIGLKNNIMDTIGASVTMSDKAKMVLDGIETAKNTFLTK
tara:strand:+ start:213 stop:1064 length:852 start_codon:yes stop_codon:yes gene_type:complete